LKGIELEVTARPVRGFTITSSFGYLDARYKTFADPISGNSLTYLNLRRAPHVTFTLSPAYEFEALGGKMTASADWHYVSSFDNTFWNTVQARNGGAHVVDAQFLYRRGGTTFSIYGRNLTRDDSYTIGLDVGRSATFPGLWTFVATRPPQTYGVSVSQNF
jgi:iron complex outermembrane receptor protein